jgi:hypothetical protein
MEVRRLAMAFRGGQGDGGPREDGEVGSEAEVLGVGLVEVDLVVFVEVTVLDELELGVAGEAGSDLVAVSASSGLGEVLGEEGAGADEAHRAGEDVEDLGELVDAQLAEDSAVAGESVLFLVGASVAGWSGHGAQLDEAERLAVSADALLGEQDGRALAQQARERGDGEDREGRP